MPGELKRQVPESGVRGKKNATGSTIGAALVVKIDTDDEEIVLTAATTDVAFGITMSAIPNGSFGDVQVQGKAICTCSAAIAIGARVMAGASGKVATYSAGLNNVVGTALTATSADGDLLEVEMAAPFTMGAAS